MGVEKQQLFEQKEFFLFPGDLGKNLHRYLPLPQRHPPTKFLAKGDISS